MVIRPGVYRRFIVLTCFITVILLQKLCLELILVRTALKQMVQKRLRRHMHGIAGCICQIVHSIIYKGISKIQFSKLIITVSCFIDRIDCKQRNILCSIAIAHHFAGNAGKICGYKIRAVFKDSVDICHSVAVGQAGKVNTFQTCAVLKQTAQMCIRVAVAGKACTLLNDHCFQVRKVLEQTVAVFWQNSAAHDHNILNIILVKVTNSSSTIAQINILCRANNIQKIPGGFDHTVDIERAVNKCITFAVQLDIA